MNPRFKLETETKVKSAALSLIDQFTAFEVEFVIETFASTARELAQEGRDTAIKGLFDVDRLGKSKIDTAAFEHNLGEDVFDPYVNDSQ